MTTQTAIRTTVTGTTPRVGRIAAALGLAGAAVTMLLSMLALALALFAIAAGIVSLRRGERPVLAAVGITAALVSSYLILLEVLWLGA